MKHLLPILAALCLFAAPAAAQTVKALSYNAANGQVLANTGTNVLTFTNSSVEFNSITATNSLNGTLRKNPDDFDKFEITPTQNAILHINNENAAAFAVSSYNADGTLVGQSLLGVRGTNGFLQSGTSSAFRIEQGGGALGDVKAQNAVLEGSLVFDGENASTATAETRTNLSLGLPALTNTSNVTMMRALSGSTDTNHPFSGTVSVVGTTNTNTLTFSNGILQAVQ